MLTNTGNVTFIAVSHSYPTRRSSDLCDASTLAPTEFTSCTAIHTVDQADLDAGQVDNTGTGHATPAGGSFIEPTDSATAFATQRSEARRAGEVSSGDPYAAVGDVVSYGYTLTNTGNVTLSAVSVSDHNTVATASCAASMLAPTEFTSCTAIHTVDQADLDAGQVDNTGTGHDTPAGGSFIEPTDSATAFATQ